MLRKYQLRNKTNLVQYSSPKSPVISIQVWVRTGSADEKKSQEGVSHFIEHLLFKGTEKYKVGEIAAVVEGSGGQLNAYTSFDQTVYYITISKDYVDIALDALSQMLAKPLFDTDEIDNEREVVVEEIKRGLDNPSRQSSQAMFSTSFKSHPYGIPVIGYEKIVRNISKKKILDYFESRYVPENMFILVCGDFEHTEMKTKVKNYFEGMENRKLKKHIRKKEPKQLRPRIKVDESGFQELLMNLSWRVPSACHKDVPGLDILAMVIGQGGSSRLYSSLRNAKNLVTSIGAYNYAPKDPGVFAISVRAQEKNIESIFNEILNELENLLMYGIKEKEIQKAVLNLESQEIFSQETVDGMANKLGSFEFYLKNPKYFSTYLKELKNINSKDLRRLAKKYLKWESLNISITTPKGKESIKRSANSFARKYKTRIEKAGKQRLSEDTKPKYRKRKKTINTSQKVRLIDLDKGAKLISQITNDVPVVNFQMVMLGGQRKESVETMGVTNFFSDVWGAGTNKRSEQDFDQHLESNCLYLGTFSGRNTLGAKLNTTSNQFSLGIESFFELLDHDKMDNNIIERERSQIIESIKNRQDHPAHIAVQMLNEHLFIGHPYAFDIEGNVESISKLSGEDLVSYKSKIFSPSNMVFSAVGDYDLQELSDKTNQYLKTLQDFKVDHLEQSLEPLGDDKKLFIPLQKEQSHLVIGYRGLCLDDEERYALKLMNAILSGQGGRLFMELRDKESLAYSVSPLSLYGTDTGYYGAYIGCSPEKAQKSFKMLELEFNKLANKMVSDQEIAAAKISLVGKHDISLQRNSSIAANYLFDYVYGISLQETDSYKEKIKEVTKEQILKLAQKIFSQKKVKVCIGSTSPF